MQERTSCKGCGTPIRPGPRERNRKLWCSAACRTRAKYPERKRAGMAYFPRSAVWFRTCSECERLYCTGSPIGKTCGPECHLARKARLAREKYAADPVAGREKVNRLRPRYAEKTRQWQREAYRRRRYGEVRACALCGAEYVAPRKYEKSSYCSKSCASTASARPTWTRRALARSKLRRAARGTRGGSRLFISGRCWSCGTSCVGLTFVGSPWPHLYCSDACRNREARARRRALTAGAKITQGRRYAVYERDGWTCQLCGGAVDPSAQVPGPAAPVIDHAIPLALGGGHSMENWQTAHFYCNSLKRDQIDVTFSQPLVVPVDIEEPAMAGVLF